MIRASLCLSGLLISLAGAGATAAQLQPPKGEEGLSFRADAMFPAGDDFVAATSDPIVGIRWWGSISDEAEPREPEADVPFTIRFYDSSGGLPDLVLASYEVLATEQWTGGFCRGIEGLGGGLSCEGPEPLYVYEACFGDDPPFVPQPGIEYWLVIKNDIFDSDPSFWAWHEADVAHPAGREAVTHGMYGFLPGMINACPGDYSSLVGPYDLAMELLAECPGACPADIDNDEVVDIDDLFAVLSAWGPCGDPEDCPADVNADELVDVDDVFAVLSAWGPCP